MKRRLIGLLAAGMLLAFPQASQGAGMDVPKDIYQWVQSTARADYYFNRQQMGFRVGEDGIIDLDTLVVPTIRIYDQAQIQDVVSKRRWKMLPMDGYGDLVGAAEYLAFRLKDGTVQVTEHDDLYSQWGTLGKETGGEPIRLDSLSELDVNGKFYRAILAYAKENRDSLILGSRSFKKSTKWWYTFISCHC